MNFIKEVFLNLLDGNRLAEQNELKRRRAAEEQRQKQRARHAAALS